MASTVGATQMVDPYATIGFALKLAQQALRTHLDAGLQWIGLTTPQYAVLTFLDTQPGASNAELARRAFVTPQTMQSILVTLERSGLISRTEHPQNRRIQKTSLTAKGRSVLGSASGIVAAAEVRLCKASKPLDPQIVAAMLLRLAEALR